MKRIFVSILVLCLLLNVIGCGNSAINIIDTVKNIKIEEYPHETIGTALTNYFSDYELSWSASDPKNNIYTVTANVILDSDTTIEFKPNNLFDEVLPIKQIYFSFNYDKTNDTIVNYKIYGTINHDGKYQFFETKNTDEASIFLNKIYGISPLDEYNSEQIEALYLLKGKIKNAKTDQEARDIAGQEDSFPLSVDYLNENRITKQEIVNMINSFIETENEILNSKKNMYN